MAVDGRALGNQGIRASDFITILHFLYIDAVPRNAMPFFLPSDSPRRRSNRNEAVLENG